MFSSKFVFVALAACGFVALCQALTKDFTPDRVVDSTSYERLLRLQCSRQRAISKLSDVVILSSCPKQNLIPCLKSDGFLNDQLLETIGVALDMGLESELTLDAVKTADDVVKAYVDELDFQTVALTNSKKQDLLWKTTNKLMLDELAKYAQILRNPSLLDDELKRECQRISSRLNLEKRRNLLWLLYYVKSMECKSGDFVACIKSASFVSEKVGDIIALAEREGEMKALSQGRVANAKDFVKGAIEALEATKKEQFIADDESEKLPFEALRQVFDEKMDQRISFMSNLA